MRVEVIRRQAICCILLWTLCSIIVQSLLLTHNRIGNKQLRSKLVMSHDILIRSLRGEAVERTPVWLMRQAGRYMTEFRKYSEKYGFRERSETPAIATELSLQPWRRFGVDGVIMFSGNDLEMKQYNIYIKVIIHL